MSGVELAPGVFCLRGNTNVGLVTQDGQGLLVDVGLDEASARQALRAVDEARLRLRAVFLTHAHADHYGGARWLQQQVDAPFYAPRMEAAMMENPTIEPLYLFGGAAPIAELQVKYTLAEPCRITHVVEPGPLEIGPFRVEIVPLPGHAPNQAGLAAGDVLFCADGVFPAETLERRKVIFCSNMDAALATLERLPGLPYERFAPGHGPAYTAGAEIEQAQAASHAHLTMVREQVQAALAEPQEIPALVRRVADHLGLRIKTPLEFILAQTTVMAALASLERAGQAQAEVEDNRLMWRRRQDV